ncbi:hypothetical protein [Streptomyces prunicolor]|uniref:hypothetical protein n=1 Tax=Streptomyces prunicolor TaxID=67348 RepID=UPI00131A3162|nr:hypothetical protein [Streptomyces prunicolor]
MPHADHQPTRPHRPPRNHPAAGAADPGDSLELLRATAGAEHVDPDIPAVQQIADLLGHLPLALSAIGRHMRAHPTWGLGTTTANP